MSKWYGGRTLHQTGLINVLVIHERPDWKRTDVDIETPYGTETKELIAR